MWRRAGTRQAIDRSHRSAQGLVFAWLGGETELRSGSPLLTKTTSTGRASLIASQRFPGQRAFSTNGANGAGGFDPTFTGPDGRSMIDLLSAIKDRHTFVWIGSHRNTPSSTARFIIPRLDAAGGASTAFTATTGGLIFGHYSGTSATWRETLYYGGPSAAVKTYYDQYNTNRFSAQSKALAWTRDGASWVSLTDGIQTKTTQTTGDIDFTSFAGWPTLNGIDYRSSSYTTMDGVSEAVLIWNRPLNMAELLSIQANPHQLLQQVRLPILLKDPTNTVNMASSMSATSTMTATLEILGTVDMASSMSATSTMTATLGLQVPLSTRPVLTTEIWTAGDSITDPAASQSVTKWWALINNAKTLRFEHNVAKSGAAFTTGYNGTLTTVSAWIDYFQTGGGAYGTLPRTYLVMAGTNDLQFGGGVSVASIQAAVSALYTKLTTQSPACRVIFCTPLPCSHTYRVNMDADRQTLRQWYIDTYLPENVIDVESLAIQTPGTTKGDWLPAYDFDGIHPNQAGQQALADIIAPYIATSGFSTMTAALEVGKFLNASMSATSTMSAAMTVTYGMASTMSATSTLAADLLVTGISQMSADLYATSTMTATLITLSALNVIVNGSSTATAVPNVLRGARARADGTSYAQARILIRLAATRRTRRRPRTRF